MNGEPDASTARIVVRRRDSGRRDRFRAHRVVIDSAPVAKIKRGQSYEVDVAPGLHSVQVKIDWCSSPIARIYLGAGERAAFACEPGGDPAGAIHDVTTGRDAYITLDVDE